MNVVRKENVKAFINYFKGLNKPASDCNKSITNRNR